MHARACTILGMWAILIAAPVWAAGGRYGTDYPVCMEALDAGGGTHIDCLYTSIEQCRQGTVGTPGTCFNNPSYKPPPPEPASVQTQSAPPAKPGKPAKSAKSAKSLQSPPPPQTR
jgi:hypothetical protein